MLFNLIFAAVAAGWASAASMPKRSYEQYGGGYGSESSSASPVVGYPDTASPAPSSTYGVYPVPPSVAHNSGYSPVPYPTGSYPSPSPSPLGGSLHPSESLLPYPIPSGSGYSPYPPPSGTGINSHPPYPIPSGSVLPPKGPTGSGSAHSPGPTGSGSRSPPGPTGTGSLPPPGQTTPLPTPQPIITTKTETGLEIITTFVRCSSPIGTAKGSTYYSTYLTMEYQTVTTTHEVVVCPATPILYSTLIVTTTVTESIPTHCAECTTYYITLPNGQPTSVIAPPVGSSSSSPPYPTHGPYKPTYPIGSETEVVRKPTGSGTGSVPKPTGSGTGSIPKPTGAPHPSNTGAPLPSGSGGYFPPPVYGGYGYGYH